MRRKACDFHKHYRSVRHGELSERIDEIRNEITAVIEAYNLKARAEREECNNFFCYYTAADSAGRMRLEQSTAWNTEKALISWIKRAKLI